MGSGIRIAGDLVTLLLLLACPPPGPAVDSALLDSGPTEDPTPGFADVSVGYWQTCAITSDGRMTCWGESPEVLEAYGWTYLGDGDPKAGATWAKVELSNAAIDTEASQSVCALDVHGQVTCWGALFQDCEDAEDCWPFGSPQGQLRSAGLEALSGRAQDLLLQLGDFALKPRDRRFDRSQLGGATLQRCRVFGQLHIALGQLRSKGGNLLVLVHTWLVVRERGLV